MGARAHRRGWCDFRTGRGGEMRRQARRLVLQDDVQGVDDAGNVTQDGEQDVDEEVGTASALEEDSDGREDDGKEDLADVAGGERHGGGGLCVRFDEVVWFGLVVRG